MKRSEFIADVARTGANDPIMNERRMCWSVD